MKPVQLPLVADLHPKPSTESAHRCRALVRTWEVLRAIDGRTGRTFAELANSFGVCERTIRRDLAALELAGFPLVDEPTDSGKRWRVLDWRKERA